MTKERLLATMREILADERAAIQRADAPAMDRASDAKELILAELHAIPFDDRGPIIEALAELQPELRQNMILLTQAAVFIAEARREARASAVRLAS